MRVGAFGSDEWVATCREAAGPHADIVTEGQVDAVLIGGPSMNGLVLADAALRKGTPIFIRDPQDWTQAELRHMQALADESSAVATSFHPWRLHLDPSLKPIRLIQIDIGFCEPVRWTSLLRHAVDLSLFAADSHNMMRIDARREVDQHGLVSLLLCTLRFQNGSMAQICLRVDAQERVVVTLPGQQIELDPTREHAEVVSSIRHLLSASGPSVPLSETVAARGVEEKIFSVLRA